MSELKKGTKIALTNGGTVTIGDELGRGGQGIVYLVDYNGKPKALKWYINAPDHSFYQNLSVNVQNGAPSSAFLWPEAITTQQNGSYGYVMALRPKNYYEFGNFLLAKTHFKSYSAMLTAALKICDGFMMLHRFGYSYQDLNDGNFFIDSVSGDVLICDNDNVMPQGQKSGIMGKARYMAPEVVAGAMPDKYSDRFSLAVILFMLFYANHPFEGAKVVACPCLTESYEKRFYGSEALFIYNPTDRNNLPVRGIHNNVIKRWPAFPQKLRDAFIQEFGEEMLRNPSKRMIEQTWEKLLVSLRDTLAVCPYCGEETFVEENHKCMNCGKSIPVGHLLQLGGRSLYLAKGSKVYLDNLGKPVAEVLCNPQDPAMLLIKNLTTATWTAETPSGKIKSVAPAECVPVKEGIKIAFTSSCKGEIK